MPKRLKAGEISGADIPSGVFIRLWFAGDEAPFIPSGWRVWFIESIGPKWVHLREAFGLQAHYRMPRNVWRHSVEAFNWAEPHRPAQGLVRAAFAASERYSAFPTRPEIQADMIAASGPET